MENKFISYDYIFNFLKPGDIFFDKELKGFYLLEKIENGILKELKIVDEDGSCFSIYNYTTVSRILLSMGIFKRIKQTIYWDKSILLSEEFANELLDKQHEEIVIDYKNMLKDGMKNGLITEKEFNELIERL